MIKASIDFGTTNSVASVNIDGKIEMVKLGKDSLHTPTALFFNFDEHKFYVGDEAISQIENAEFGRYFVSLKSFLGTEDKLEINLLYKSYTIDDLISIILKRFKEKIEKHIGEEVTNLTLGRPVKFNDTNSRLDILAEDRLKNAAMKAGFKKINFCFEPVAASLSYNTRDKERLLVADIGGGTTDYTIIDNSKVLVTNGIYIGGNNFDSRIIRGFVSTYLGEGLIYNSMGKDLKVSHSLFVDLYEYYKFIKMYDIQIIESIKKYIHMSYDKVPLKRLLELIEENLYFDFLKEIIDSKIELSTKSNSEIDMSFFTDKFTTTITKEQFILSTKDEVSKIEERLFDTLKAANLTPNDIDRVLLTGGTTLIPSVKTIYKDIFGEDKLIQKDVFTTVGYGLSLYS